MAADPKPQYRRRSPQTRVWVTARGKVVSEGACRVGGDCNGELEAAHVISRQYDDKVVAADAIVPLCARHHRAYDERGLDLLPYLTMGEQGHAAALVGLVSALRRTTGGRS